jgi:hypothetical protein
MILDALVSSRYGRPLLKQRIREYFDDLQPPYKKAFISKRFDGGKLGRTFNMFKKLSEMMRTSSVNEDILGGYRSEKQAYKKLGIYDDINTYSVNSNTPLPMRQGHYALNHCFMMFDDEIVAGIRTPKNTYYIITPNGKRIQRDWRKPGHEYISVSYVNMFGLRNTNLPKRTLWRRIKNVW